MRVIITTARPADSDTEGHNVIPLMKNDLLILTRICRTTIL